MGLFKSKPKISIEESCKQFYDSQIFHAIIAGTDFWSDFLDTVSKSVAEADQSFSLVDPSVFQREMTALRMELFGLAWSHKFKREEFTLPQSFFTKRYLEENGRLDIWDIMGGYNQAIARSAVTTANGEQMDAWSVTQINKLRADMFYKWAETNIGDRPMTKEDKAHAKCVARVASRIRADIRRADCIAVKLLAARLADCLECNISLKTEAIFRLETAIFGFYIGAEEYLKSVNLQV